MINLSGDAGSNVRDSLARHFVQTVSWANRGTSLLAEEIDALTAVLKLPPGQDPVQAAGGAELATGDLSVLEVRARDKLVAAVTSGNAAAMATVKLLDLLHDSRVGTGTPTPQPQGDGVADMLYVAAVQAFESGAMDRAAALLAIAYASPEARNDTALGLAICAVRLGRLDEALPLAAESLRRGSRHPRAMCIVGLCELARGNKALAQEHLALAARVARSQPAYREDMRIAQRLLLIRHFG